MLIHRTENLVSLTPGLVGAGSQKHLRCCRDAAGRVSIVIDNWKRSEYKSLNGDSVYDEWWTPDESTRVYAETKRIDGVKSFSENYSYCDVFNIEDIKKILKSNNLTFVAKVR